MLSRASENIFLKQKFNVAYLDDDTLKDPVSFISAREVAKASERCLNILQDYQLSTFGYKARQLTPVSIKQLTQPEWSKEFPFTGGVEDA